MDSTEISNKPMPKFASTLLETTVCKVQLVEARNFSTTSGPVAWIVSGASPLTTMAYVASKLLRSESVLALRRLVCVTKSTSIYWNGTLVMFSSASAIARFAPGAPTNNCTLTTESTKDPTTLKAARHLHTTPSSRSVQFCVL